jgi:hypothetical protein
MHAAARYRIPLSVLKAQTFTMASELRTVLSPLLSHEGEAIWVTASSYVHLAGHDYYAADYRHEKQFGLRLGDKDGFYNLSIHASTLEESIICLDYLVGLQDTHFQETRLTRYSGIRQLYSFGTDILEKILQNSARRRNLLQQNDLHARALSYDCI